MKQISWDFNDTDDVPKFPILNQERQLPAKALSPTGSPESQAAFTTFWGITYQVAHYYIAPF